MGDCIIHEVLILFWGFTRFWSLPSPAEGHLRGQCHSGSLFTRFWSRSLCYFRHDRSDFCLSVNSVKYYYFSLLLWISTSLMGSSPIFPASFPAKSNVFRRNRPIWFPISCCFFMKVDHIWCPSPVSPVSPNLRGFDLVLGIPHVGERYKPRESAPCAMPAERSKPRA